MVFLWNSFCAEHLPMFFVSFREKILPEFPVDFLRNVYKRFVDVIFVTFDSYSLLLKFIDYKNHQHPNIKFTFEIRKTQ